MNTPGRYAASDGSFAKSAGNAAARGGILIGVAVVIGLLLLWKGFDGGDDSADVGSANGIDDTSTTLPDDGDAAVGGDDETTTTLGDGEEPPTNDPGDTTTPVVVRPPAEVTVMVLNGTGTGGLAAERSSALGAVGYVVEAGNTATKPVADSKVYYTETFAEEAKAVAEALSGPAAVLAAAPADVAALADDNAAAKIETADVIVVLGADEALS